MYCINCGKKLGDNEIKCSNCGIENASEYCGGFWGLVSRNEQKEELPKIQITEDSSVKDDNKEIRDENTEVVDHKSKRKSKKHWIFAVVAAVVCISVILLISNTVNSHKKESKVLLDKEMLQLQVGNRVIEQGAMLMEENLECKKEIQRLEEIIVNQKEQIDILEQKLTSYEQNRYDEIGGMQYGGY